MTGCLYYPFSAAFLRSKAYPSISTTLHTHLFLCLISNPSIFLLLWFIMFRYGQFFREVVAWLNEWSNKMGQCLFIFCWFIIPVKPGFIYAMKNVFLEWHQYGEASSPRPSGMMLFQGILCYSIFLSYQTTKSTLIKRNHLDFLHCQIIELHAIVKLASCHILGKLNITCMLAF